MRGSSVLCGGLLVVCCLAAQAVDAAEQPEINSLPAAATRAPQGPPNTKPDPGSSNGGKEIAADEPFVVWMQSIHDEWAVPGYAELYRASRTLESRLGQLCASAADTDAFKQSLPASQQAWRDTMQVWRRLEALQLGPTLAHKTSKRIDFWPTRPKTIDLAAANTENVAVNGADAKAAMGRWGGGAQGLPALEWLLFPGAGESMPPAAHDAAHCRYAQRASYVLTGEVERLGAAWRAEAERWHATPRPDVQRQKYTVLNLLVGSIELLRGKKLENAARLQALGGPDSREDRLDLFDGMRSRSTRQFLLTHLEGVAQIMLGKNQDLPYTTAAPVGGLADVLIAQRHGPAHRMALQAGIVAAHGALSALPDDPRTWTPEMVAPAARALVQLRGAIDPTIARLWQVKIDFTDADGD